MKTIKQYNWILVLAMVYLIPFPTWAGQVTIPNSFSAGTPASAAQVNGNFGAVTTAVNDNDARIAALEQTIASLTATVNNLQSELEAANTSIDDINNSSVMGLGSYVNVANDTRGPIITFTGVNLKLVNGTGTTAGEPNGLGNLSIGYDIERIGRDVDDYYHTYMCSDGSYETQTSCESNGNTWNYTHRSGSHNLVIGDKHNYSRFGAIISGSSNASIGNYASVITGRGNIAIGDSSIVAGGSLNRTYSIQSSVLGGGANATTGTNAVVSGGSNNSANGYFSSVNGGSINTANHSRSSIHGGYGVTTTADYDTLP